MNRRYVKKMLISILATSILMTCATSCGVNSGASNIPETIEIVKVEKTAIEKLEKPAELALLKSNTIFRSNMDSFMNINKISVCNPITSKIEQSKQGCIYTVNKAGKDVQSGDTTLHDAMRNKQFIEKYYNDNDFRNNLISEMI